jgi:serine/threonine-protein kinase
MLQKIGRYEIFEELGRGAMGVVYKARDPVIGRFVAIKTVRLGDLGAGYQMEELKTRLVREAQAAGSLSHPSIITIFDVGEEDDLSYIAMELVEGMSLEALLESKQFLEESTILHVARQVADALGYAHEHGIVHRDIKPANIMLTKDGRVKVADFGIAKVASSKMTQTGMLLGSPSYMAPEHFLGQPLDGRSDIFALGIVLYELITGQLPFPGENLGTLSYKVVHEDVLPPRRLKPTISDTLESIILRALARDPSRRFQTASELCRVLDGIVASTASVPAVSPIASATEQSVPGAAGKAYAKTLAAASQHQKPSRRRMYLLLALLLVGAGSLAFAFASPRQFQQTLLKVKTQAQSWLDRIAGRPSSPASVPTSQSSLHRPDGVDRASSSAGTPLTSTDESVRKEIAAVGEKGKPEAPRAATTAAAGTQTSEDAKSSAARSPASPGKLDVSSTPPGAQIILDDKADATWMTPFTFETVPIGRHTLEFKKAGYSTERRIVVLQGNAAQRINVVLSPVSGILKVITVPGGAQIYVDGELKSETTPATLKLRAGSRRIRLRKEGYQEAEQLVEIEDNSVTTLNQQLLEATP